MKLYSAQKARSKAPPKKRDREATKNKLLAAGLHVFAKFGFDAATTQAVAKKAGVNEALISRYFKGKSGLLAALVIRFVETIDSEYLNEDLYPPGKTVEEEIANFLRFRLGLDVKHRSFLRVAISKAAVDAKFRANLQPHIPVEGHVFLATRLEAFQQLKKIDPKANVMEISKMLTFYGLGLLFSTCIIDSIPVTELYEVIELAARSYAHGLEQRT